MENCKDRNACIDILLVQKNLNSEASQSSVKILEDTIESKNLKRYVNISIVNDFKAQKKPADILVIDIDDFITEEPPVSRKPTYVFFLFNEKLSVDAVERVQGKGRFELFPVDRFYGNGIEYSEIARFAESIKRVVRELLSERVLESEMHKRLDWKISFNKDEKRSVSSFITDPVFQKPLLQARKTIDFLKSYKEELFDFRKETRKSLEELRRYENASPEADLKNITAKNTSINSCAKNLKTKKIYGILLTGPTGCGKTRLAEWIAKAFLGKDDQKYFGKIPFVNISPNLIDSELFGTFPGAFTDARYKMGKLLSCAGGVVFLDEIGEIPPSIQAKLLTFMDDRKALIEGYNDPDGITIPLLLIGATNRDLHQEMGTGGFRKDLFHRFTFRIHLPPLKERKNDFRYLLSYALQAQNANIPNSPVEAISLKAIEDLEHYDFPGNFRELEEIVRQALLNAGFDGRTCILRKDIEGPQL
ncbi:MAG: sigma-54-dependent Fis family transcriptional regulator [Thermotogaceae bacterium]|nr:sigma-54-dependent Fis family transcriptional regulator [Thermotogaceae bacterium]